MAGSLGVVDILNRKNPPQYGEEGQNSGQNIYYLQASSHIFYPPQPRGSFEAIMGPATLVKSIWLGSQKSSLVFFNPQLHLALVNFPFKNCLPTRLRGGSKVSVSDVLPQISSTPQIPYLNRDVHHSLLEHLHYLYLRQYL